MPSAPAINVGRRARCLAKSGDALLALFRATQGPIADRRSADRGARSFSAVTLSDRSDSIHTSDITGLGSYIVTMFQPEDPRLHRVEIESALPPNFRQCTIANGYRSRRVQTHCDHGGRFKRHLTDQRAQ